MKRLPLLVLLLLAACSSTPDLSSYVPDVANYVKPYRIDVRQGNLVTQEMVAQLKVGQSRDQVRFILGTPLVADLFHGDRWDYVYRLQYGSSDPGKVEHRRFVVFFEKGKLVRVGGDVTGEDSGAPAAPAKPTARVIEIEAPKKDEPKKDEPTKTEPDNKDAATPEATAKPE